MVLLVKPCKTKGNMNKEQLREGVKLYKQLKDKQFPFSLYGGFFAFGNDQFDTNKIGTAPFVSLGMGLYCSKATAPELKKHFDLFCKDKNAFIWATVNPFCMFAYEFENHECSYTGNYEIPYDMVKEIYGETIANEIINYKEFIEYLNGDQDENVIQSGMAK
jgi:hypothetical protein